MLRITPYIQELLNSTPLKPARKPKGPVVIWNLIRRCNLMCKHCYSISVDSDFPGELSTDEIYKVMDNLKAFHVPVLILSGGEPLMHKDIFKISQRAKDMGFYVALSTNGTLINEDNISKIIDMGYDYVGISLDGIGKVHDQFRRQEGAYDKSLTAVRLCKQNGVKIGLRFTLTQDNQAQFPKMLELLETEEIDKFYLSHLNYGGRGNKNRKDDVVHQMTRDSMDKLFETCLNTLKARKTREFVSGNNDADGVYLLHWAKKHFPEKAAHLQAKLEQWGGNSSGVNIANIDNLGNVHPDTFWWNYDLGNIKDRPFSEIWQDTSDPLMAGLKQNPRPLKGRCASCRYLNICGGNTRVRAYQMTGDAWNEDPGCYLNDDEIS
ncbi:MAG: heme d1 biosynthesis radical SAM protein NirJ [Pseudomonadota bacterium]